MSTVAIVALWLIAAVAVGVVITYAAVLFGRFSRHTDEEASRLFREHIYMDYQMRYKGGNLPCVVCGKPTPYTLNGRPIHPEHREAA